MKVVEKLFNNYLQVAPDLYVAKYLGAMSVLEITEPQDSEDMKQIRRMRDSISKEFPISIFKATKFLESKETKLTYAKSRNNYLELNKSKGHDYKIRDALGIYIEKINGIVVRSMSKYNTDRGRQIEEEFDFEGFD